MSYQAHNNDLAKASLLLGLTSFFFLLGIITALPGIIVGHVARSRAIQYPHQYSGSRLAMLGLILCWMSIGMWVLLIAVANHLNVNGDLMPLLDALDESGVLSSFAKTLLDYLPFVSS